MASVIVGSSNLGEVKESNQDNKFPAMDTNYRELRWVIKFERQFLNFNQLIAYENNSIKSLLNDREQNVQYGGQTVNDMVILSIKRIGVPKVANEISNTDGSANNNKIIAEFELIATKEDA